MKQFVKLNDKEVMALKMEAKRTNKTVSQILREGLGLYFAVQKEMRKSAQERAAKELEKNPEVKISEEVVNEELEVVDHE